MAPALRGALKEDKAAWVGRIAQDAAKAAERSDQRALRQYIRRLGARPMSQPKRLLARDGTCVATATEAAQ
eukprot:4657840-Alexandrium_andersonii.AAC.1